MFNFELPNVPEQYVHRIGRTARAGADGMAISFCADDEKPYLRDIEKLTRQKIDVRSLPDDFQAEAAKLVKARVNVPMDRDETNGRTAAPSRAVPAAVVLRQRVANSAGSSPPRSASARGRRVAAVAVRAAGSGVLAVRAAGGNGHIRPSKLTAVGASAPAAV